MNPALLDVHRPIPRHQGGEYTNGNFVVISPVDHMKEHKIYREREEQIEVLKAMFDERNQMLKNKNAMANRLLAGERQTDFLDDTTKDFLKTTVKEYDKHLKKFERKITKHLQTMQSNYPIIPAMLSLKGVGPVAVAQIIRYVDITKCRYASSLWAYVGYDKPQHKRYSKGTAGGGNKTLRSALYVLADSFIKQRNVYRDIYDRTKADLEVSEKYTLSYKTGHVAEITDDEGRTKRVQGKLTEVMWKEAKPGHRHGAAIRKMMKHFLADLWKVWRTLEGLDTPLLYPEAKLGHKGIVQPKERGWKY